MIFKTILIFIFIVTALAFSQETNKYTYPRDTTYTLKITYDKYKKYYPFIKAVEYDKAGSRIKSITYSTPAGRPLMLDIIATESDSEITKPAVILIHGGGWSSGDKSLMHPLASYLAEQGYIALAVEYRLSPEAKYPAAIDDIKNAISWTMKNGREYHIDTNKMAILGCSAGAQIAGLVGLTYGKDQKEDAYQKPVQAIINIDGIMDFTSPQALKHENNPTGKLTPAGRWFGGRYAEKPELWKEASPLYFIDKNSPPILFINSSQPRFHAGRDEAIEKMNTFSIYSRIYTFDDAPHSFWFFDPWFERTGLYIDTFLQRVLNHKK